MSEPRCTCDHPKDDHALDRGPGLSFCLIVDGQGAHLCGCNDYRAAAPAGPPPAAADPKNDDGAGPR